MDPEVVVQSMISQQLLSEDVIMTAQSCYHKNCLILEQVRLMNAWDLILLVSLLKADNNQQHIGDMLDNG